MSDSKNSPTPQGAPARPTNMPLVAAVVALIALAAVIALYMLRREAMNGVVEERIVVPTGGVPAAKQAAAAAPETPSVPPAASPAAVPSGAAAAASGLRSEVGVGDVFQGTISGVGSRGDGRLRVRGKTVYIPGTKEGDAVRYRIVRDTGGFFLGEVVPAGVPLTVLKSEEKLATPVATAEGAATAPAVAPATNLPAGVLDGTVATADNVKVGAEFSVVITDKDRFSPEKNGFCRIGGFAVVVADAQPGSERIRIRITERLERRANAEVVR